MKCIMTLLAVLAMAGYVSAITVDGIVDPEYGAPIASDSSTDGAGNENMNLLDLYAVADASNLYVAFTINADIVATDWGKYMLYFDTDNVMDSGATSDAWGRNVIVTNTMHLPEFTCNTWVDSPPYGTDHTQFVPWDGAAWDWGAAGTPIAAALTGGATSVVEYAISWAQLDNPVGTIFMEVYSTGGGDSDNAQDTINNPAEDWNASDWSTQATVGNSSPFVIPEPGVMIGLLLSGFALLRRR
jgi:hypothetical protein